MLLVVLVCLSVCLWTTLLRKLWTDWDEILWSGPKWYNEELIKLWWWPGYSTMSKWAKKIIIVVAYPDRGAGNDSKLLGLAFHHQGSTLLHWEIWEYWSASAREVCSLYVLIVYKMDCAGWWLFLLHLLANVAF